MAEHNVTLELFYDGVWNPAPLRGGDPVRYSRGVKQITNDTDPASGSASIDNHSGNYAPRSPLSGLRGKIGQNTPARLSADGSVRLSGEVAEWRPKRGARASAHPGVVGYNAWTEIQLAGVLQRLGRGADPLRPALTRAALASSPVDWWALDEGRLATSGANAVQGGAPMTSVNTSAEPTWGGLDAALVPAGMEALPLLNGASLGAAVRATSTTSWRFEAVYGIEGVFGGGLDVIRGATWRTSGGINTWWIEHGETATIIWAYSDYAPGLLFGSVVIGGAGPQFHDGQMHHIALNVVQTTATDFQYLTYLDGVLKDFGTNSTGTTVGRPQIGPPGYVTINPDRDARMLSAGGVGFWSPAPGTPVAYAAVGGYAGELAADRFTRLCAEESLTATVTGTAAETMAMGPQTTAPLLDQFDEIARTDDGQIFETRAALGLTMKTGRARQNQTTALTINYLGHIAPPLVPVFGDTGLRNDVTARNPDGSSGRYVQLTGPRNVQAPGADPRGVGRYTTSVDVNVSDSARLVDAAGWRVNLGTFDGTWYLAVTVDLDAAPGLVAAVNAVEIGDTIAIANVPVEEALDTVPGVVIGISEDLPPRRRLVTFYVIPGQPYAVGVLANTVGDTAALVGHAESDGATVTSAVAAGAATFQITIPSGPLWTTTADDFPMDVLAGGQRVTLSGVAGGASPQTATVATTSGSYPVAYPILAGATLEVAQPIIATL